MRKLVALFSIMLIVIAFGCASLSELVTPADKDIDAIKYTVDAGVAEPNEYDGYFNLYKSGKLMQDVDTAYILNRQELEQAVEREDTIHSIHARNTLRNDKVAAQREEALFGETGLIPMIAGIAGFSGLSGVIGLMRKRPGDITKVEMESAINTATGKSKEELSVKERQFIQVVKGVQEFMNTEERLDGDYVLALVESMNKHQDKDTQAAVAVVKKTV